MNGLLIVHIGDQTTVTMYHAKTSGWSFVVVADAYVHSFGHEKWRADIRRSSGCLERHVAAHAPGPDMGVAGDAGVLAAEAD